MKMRNFSLLFLAAMLIIALIACGKGGPAESGLSKGETGKVSASHRPGHGGGGGGGDGGGGGGGGGGTPGPGDWNQMGHDAQHTGRSPFAGPNSATLKFVYQLPKIASALHGVTFGEDGTAYFGLDDGYLYAVNPSGSLKWKMLTANNLVRSTPAIGQDGTIYVSSSKTFYAVNPNGTVKWSFSTAPSFSGTATLGSDGTIFLPGGQFLYAINPDGSLQWSYNLHNDYCETDVAPAIGSDGTIFVGITMDAYEGGIMALTPDGESIWIFVTDLAARSPVVGDDGTIYCSGTSELFALSPDGSILWTYSHSFSAYPVWGRKAIGSDGTMYYSFNNKLVAIDSGGSESWSYSFGTGFRASTVAVDSNGTIYAGTQTDSGSNGRVYAFNPDGSVKWSFLTNGSRPGGYKGGTVGPLSIAQDGSIYFLCTDWRLYALGPGAG